MKKLLPLFGFCALLLACADTETTQPKTPSSTTTTTGAPAPADTTAPSDDKPIPPLNLQSPTTNPPAASMSNTTSSSAGDPPMSPDFANSTSGSAIQGDSNADLKTTAKIRRSLDSNSALSFGAKNVTIQTSNGRVTLRGAVKSEREKAIVESAASQVAGASQVDDQLSVAK
jgi:hyperosmotically inducible protein